MPWPRRVSQRPLKAEAQVRSQDAALNSVADLGPLGVCGAGHSADTSPKRYQSYGHTQRNCSCTPVLFVTGLAPVVGPLRSSRCSCRKVWGKLTALTTRVAHPNGGINTHPATPKDASSQAFS